jgi:hypothetical protein
MATATPSQYHSGSIKQDPATLAIAVRTALTDPTHGTDWGVMTTGAGGYRTSYDTVQYWPDAYVSPS